MAIQIKRAYDPPGARDGTRILVDRVWPRGIKKEALRLHEWRKDVAPSTTLRKWFAHDPAKWAEFQRRYSKELDASPAAWEPILTAASKKTVTLIYGARDQEHNNAIALRTYLESRRK